MLIFPPQEKRYWSRIFVIIFNNLILILYFLKEQIRYIIFFPITVKRSVMYLNQYPNICIVKEYFICFFKSFQNRHLIFQILYPFKVWHYLLKLEISFQILFKTSLICQCLCFEKISSTLFLLFWGRLNKQN